MAIWNKETDALGMLCPILTSPGKMFRCEGSKCMAWEWKVAPDPRYIQGPPIMVKSDVDGRCALIKGD